MIAFEVKDMTCGHCVSTLTKALKGADEDARVQIDLATHRVQVESKLSDAAKLSQVIREAGYTPSPVPAETSTAPVAASKRSGCCCG